jgi:hypothetical protein
MSTDEVLLALWLEQHDDDTPATYAAALTSSPVGCFRDPDTVCLSCCPHACDEPTVYPTDIATGNVGPTCGRCGRPVCTAGQIAVANAWADQHSDLAEEF